MYSWAEKDGQYMDFKDLRLAKRCAILLDGLVKIQRQAFLRLVNHRHSQKLPTAFLIMIEYRRKKFAKASLSQLLIE